MPTTGSGTKRVTRTNERRLDEIEKALTPKAVFLLWLGDVQHHQTLAEHVLDLVKRPIEEHPMQTLPKQVERAVRAANKQAGRTHGGDRFTSSTRDRKSVV